MFVDALVSTCSSLHCQLSIPVYTVPLYRLRREPPPTRKRKRGQARRVQSPAGTLLSPGTINVDASAAVSPTAASTTGVRSWCSRCCCCCCCRRRAIVPDPEQDEFPVEGGLPAPGGMSSRPLVARSRKPAAPSQSSVAAVRMMRSPSIVASMGAARGAIRDADGAAAASRDFDANPPRLMHAARSVLLFPLTRLGLAQVDAQDDEPVQVLCGVVRWGVGVVS